MKNDDQGVVKIAAPRAETLSAAPPPAELIAAAATKTTPVLLGRRFTLNPVVIFVSLIVWTWLWGVLLTDPSAADELQLARGTIMLTASV